MWAYRWEPLTVSHHSAMFGCHRYCGSGDMMFLETEVKNSTCSRLNLHVECHIRNFSIKITLTKTFASLPSESNRILVTPSCVTNDEIYGKKTFVGLSKNSNSKEKKKLKNRKASAKLFALRANIISSLKNIQLLPKLLVIA